jgi:hypothetical protein
MKENFLSLLFMAFLLTPHPALASPSPVATDGVDAALIRAEFDDMFGESEIYRVIRKHLPVDYENFYQAYLADRNSGRKDIGIADFVNSIRSAYLKQACDESILGFFRYSIDKGRELLAKDPEAAFSYMFGGSQVAYEEHLDLAVEQERLGQLLDQMLSSRAAENSRSIDRAEVESGLDYVYVLLYYKHGKNFSLLTRNSSSLTAEERHQLSAIYLDMFEEIFILAPTTRRNVLRSMAMKL